MDNCVEVGWLYLLYHLSPVELLLLHESLVYIIEKNIDKSEKVQQRECV